MAAVNYAPGGSTAVAVLEFQNFDGQQGRAFAGLRNSANFGGQAPCEFGALSAVVVKYDNGARKAARGTAHRAPSLSLSSCHPAAPPAATARAGSNAPRLLALAS